MDVDAEYWLKLSSWLQNLSVVLSLSVSSLSFCTCVCLGDLCAVDIPVHMGVGLWVCMCVDVCVWRREADYWNISSVTGLIHWGKASWLKLERSDLVHLASQLVSGILSGPSECWDYRQPVEPRGSKDLNTACWAIALYLSLNSIKQKHKPKQDNSTIPFLHHLIKGEVCLFLDFKYVLKQDKIWCN